MFFDYPFTININGRSKVVEEEKHIKNLIEQVLFTSPGERVNRPDFGCGLKQLIFEPNSDIVALSINTIVQSSLQRWLDHLITVKSVDVKNDDSILTVKVTYFIRKNRKPQVSTFSRSTI